ncbi:hypothetical protein CUN67_24260 (plasmid) [Pantoea cypripedii]|uniref:Transposase n=1 Tax=Pantoea cypripedii TaxID=55209 RepID=A0A6B9GHN3_PANCY|nr:hypothetical protein CUN67_24260 [Pantoea cypripedii]
MVEVLSGPERRRRRTPQEKTAIIQQTMEPGMTVSHVARLHGINANQIFKWRRQYEDGSLTAERILNASPWRVLEFLERHGGGRIAEIDALLKLDHVASGQTE